LASSALCNGFEKCPTYQAEGIPGEARIDVHSLNFTWNHFNFESSANMLAMRTAGVKVLIHYHMTPTTFSDFMALEA